MRHSVEFGAAIVLATLISACDSPRVSAAKEAVRNGMRDPDSVEFRGIYETERAVCGEVNAKNAFGAYVGFRPFYAYGDSPKSATVVNDIESTEARSFRQWCLRSPRRGASD